MANTKISALTAITGPSVDTTADVLPIVDTSVATTKKIVVDDLVVAMAATQAEMVTGTSVSTVATPGRQHFHESAVKAWGYITTAGGTPTLQDSYGVTSITDSGPGNYTINLSVTFANSLYAVTATVGNAASGQLNYSVSAENRATTSFKLTIQASDGTDTDADVSFMAAGTLA